MIPDAPAVQVSLVLGAKGINYAPSSACSSAADAIGQAYYAIIHGDAKRVIAGGTDAPVITARHRGFLPISGHFLPG